MKSDFETIKAISLKASGIIGDELSFFFPDVVEVIKLCTTNEIAVLGVEIFQACNNKYLTKNYSIYDQKIVDVPKQKSEWRDYIETNNSYAEEFIRQNPIVDKQFYVLTTASWKEFCLMKEMR